MTRTYAVKYKSKSKMLTTPEQVAKTEEDIKALALVKDAVIVTVEVENEEDFEPVMDRVVNIFRRIDDKSEVSYKFGLNRE